MDRTNEFITSSIRIEQQLPLSPNHPPSKVQYLLSLQQKDSLLQAIWYVCSDCCGNSLFGFDPKRVGSTDEPTLVGRDVVQYIPQSEKIPQWRLDYYLVENVEQQINTKED